MNFTITSLSFVAGLTLRIEVSNEYINRTSGLCGKFDGISSNDRMGSDGLLKTTLTELAQSWNVEAGHCSVGEFPHEKMCEEVFTL